MNIYFVIIIRFLAKIILWFMGFKIVGDLPEGLKKFVIIAAPHTANRDFLLALGWLKFREVRPMFVGKESIFYPPYGWFFRWLGGIPDNRYRNAAGKKSESITDIVVAEFAKHDNIAFGIAPEGTRKLVKQWKQGFYHIAVRANVPIVVGVFDFENKEIRVETIFYPTGDIDADMRLIMSYYKDVKGLRPERFSIDERYS